MSVSWRQAEGSVNYTKEEKKHWLQWLSFQKSTMKLITSSTNTFYHAMWGNIYKRKYFKMIWTRHFWSKILILSSWYVLLILLHVIYSYICTQDMFVYYALLLYTVEIAYTVQLCMYIHHISLLVKSYLACKWVILLSDLCQCHFIPRPCIQRGRKYLYKMRLFILM